MQPLPPRKHVHGRLWWRQLIYLIAAAVLTALIIYDMATGAVGWYFEVLAYAIGTLVGYGYGRLARVRWHETDEHVMIQNDAVSILIIIAYLVLRSGSDFLLRDWFTGAALSAITFAFLAGILLGRYLGIIRSIYRVLREQGKLTS